MKTPSVGFVVWNPFQIMQFENVAAAYPGSRYLLLNRGQSMSDFRKYLSGGGTASVEIIPRELVSSLDGCFDVLFFQSPFPSIENIRKSRLVSLQYGLAKERHNYGEWRSLADMNLMYGDYSAAFADHFAPSFAVGNVKFAGWDLRRARSDRAALIKRLNLDPHKKTLLFMPTYGELGSFDDLLKPLANISTTYNVIIKMHHNNERIGKTWIAEAKELGLCHLYGGEANQLDLLTVSDVVISDFSGAIFDAIYAEVPVLLYQARVDEVVNVQKFEKSSLEFRRRDELGEVCTSIADFLPAIQRTLAHSTALVARSRAIRRELFVDAFETNPVKLIQEKVGALLDGEVPALTAPQLIVRDTCRTVRKLELENARLRRTAKNRSGLLASVGLLFSKRRKPKMALT